MGATVEVKDLEKRYGPIVAVDGVSFSVERGEILGFLGPNGAGKSTTMKMIAGFLPPTRGAAIVCGHDALRDPIAAKKRIGYLPEGAPLYGDMTPESFLKFVAEIRGFRGKEKRERVDAAIEKTHLREVARQPIETLSKGFKRRVGLAQAILHDPDVLILDEPTDGLDPNQKREVRRLIRAMAREKVIILSTHILEEVSAVCTRAIVIAKGRLVADATPRELEARSRYRNAVTFHSPEQLDPEAIEELEGFDDVAEVEALGRSGDLWGYTAVAAAGLPILAEVEGFLREREIDAEELRVERGRLEEVFWTLTSASEEAYGNEFADSAAGGDEDAGDEEDDDGDGFEDYEEEDYAEDYGDEDEEESEDLEDGDGHEDEDEDGEDRFDEEADFDDEDESFEGEEDIGERLDDEGGAPEGGKPSKADKPKASAKPKPEPPKKEKKPKPSEAEKKPEPVAAAAKPQANGKDADDAGSNKGGGSKKRRRRGKGKK